MTRLIAELRKEVDELKKKLEQPPSPGKDGRDGKDGEPGTITIILIGENGKELKRATGVMSGSVVRLPVRRYLREGAK